MLGNGQDGKNDAGQFAMIDTVKSGQSDVSFIFVAQQSDDCASGRRRGADGKVEFYNTTNGDILPQGRCPVEGTKPLQPLKFEKLKALSYPGGDRYKTYDPCEQNEFAEGCG